MTAATPSEWAWGRAASLGLCCECPHDAAARCPKVVAVALDAARAQGREDAVVVMNEWHLPKSVRTVLTAAIRARGP